MLDFPPVLRLWVFMGYWMNFSVYIRNDNFTKKKIQYPLNSVIVGLQKTQCVNHARIKASPLMADTNNGPISRLWV